MDRFQKQKLIDSIDLGGGGDFIEVGYFKKI